MDPWRFRVKRTNKTQPLVRTIFPVLMLVFPFIGSQQSFERTEDFLLRIEASFICSSIVDNYCMLLTEDVRLGSSTTHYVAKMFYRIFVKHQAESLFYKVNAIFQRPDFNFAHF